MTPVSTFHQQGLEDKFEKLQIIERKQMINHRRIESQITEKDNLQVMQQEELPSKMSSNVSIDFEHERKFISCFHQNL